MNSCILFVALALSALFCCSVAQIGEQVNCLARNCNGTCPTVDPSQCDSGKTMQCGCCEVCVVYLPLGAPCMPFIQTNGVCRPGQVCSGGTCQKR